MPPLSHCHKERRQVQLPADDDTTPACVKLHGLLPVPRVLAIITHEPALIQRPGVGTVWTNGAGRHSSDPQHRSCGIGYYTDTQERVWLPLLGLTLYSRSTPNSLLWCVLWKSANRTKRPEGRNRDLDKRALNALLPGQRIRWMKALETRRRPC
eukprot:5364571-Amphidinium_carterae.2